MLRCVRQLHKLSNWSAKIAILPCSFNSFASLLGGVHVAGELIAALWTTCTSTPGARSYSIALLGGAVVGDHRDQFMAGDAAAALKPKLLDPTALDDVAAAALW